MVDAQQPWIVDRVPTAIELLARASLNSYGNAWKRSKVVAKYSLPLLKGTLKRALTGKKCSLGNAPKTRFNKKISPHRVFEAVNFELSEIKRVAKQIRDRPEVEALRDELANWCQQDQFACALILRSAAVDADTSTIRGDYDALRQTAKTLEARLQQRSAGLAYTSPSLVVQAVDKASVTDCELEHTPIVWPAVLSRDSASTSTIKLDTGIVPLFERCGVQRAIDELLQSRVALRHGGELVIEQTEAMITIDVNSRADQRPPREVNLEAVAKCAEQILLRNLGGLIVVDLIDMIERKDRTAVERAIARALSTDDLQHEIAPITSFGLLQIKRQRGGFNAGRTVPASTILLDQLMRELFSLTQASAVRAYTILVAEPLAFALLNTFAPNLARIQDLLDLKLTVCAKKHWSNSSYTIKPSPT